MIKQMFVAFCVLFTGMTGTAQYVELGGMLGSTNYMGDLVPPRAFFLERNIGGQLQVAYNLTPRFAVQTAALFGTLSGTDVNSTYDSGRRQRNLHFKSSLWEFSCSGRLGLLPFVPHRRKKPITPYASVGIAVFGFNPQASLKGEWVDLQPLGTEGQGLDGYASPYALTNVSIPIALGFKWALGKRVHFLFEFGFRKTFTDYLDDVSGDYVKLSELEAKSSRTALALSNRTLDKYGQQIEMYGNPRGHAGKDWYAFFGAGLVVSMQKGTVFKKKRAKTVRKINKHNAWM